MDRTSPQQIRAGDEKIRAARLSIISNGLLTALKLAVGLFSGSVSVVSEAAHSATDLVASIIAYFSVRVADQPADKEHPYGHGKIESVSGLAEALLIVAAAGWIIYEAVTKLLSRQHKPSVDLGMVVMLLSVIVNTLVARYLGRVARETDSLALEADAKHLSTDVYTSVGVLLGLAVVRITGWSAADPIMALAVALLIIHAGWSLARSAWAPLVDTQLPEEEIQIVRDILEADANVLGYHKLRTRKSGSHRHVDAHIQLEDEMSLLEAHDVTEKLEDDIRAELPNTEITLHTEPFRAELRHQYEKHGGPHPKEEP